MTPKSKIEVGHAKNVANFEDLVARCISYGSIYNPFRPELQVAGLQQLLSEARMALDQLIDAVTTENNAINQRANLFKDLPSFVTRIVNALAAGGAKQKTLEDAKGIQRKITGKRASKKEENKEAAPEGEKTGSLSATAAENGVNASSKQRSSSQQSYDMKIEHFARLVSLLQNEPTYTPNELELQLSTLQNKLMELRSANTQVTNATAAAEAARRLRDRVLYHEESGLCVRAQQVKLYVKSIFGATSREFKELNRIKFRVIGY